MRVTRLQFLYLTLQKTITQVVYRRYVKSKNMYNDTKVTFYKL